MITHKRITPYQQTVLWCRKNGLSENMLKMIPRNYTRYGKTIVLRFKVDMPPNVEAKIAEGWARSLHATTVLKITGIVKGVYREPKMVRIFGNGGEVMHRENKIIYKFDPEKVMFSKGNMPERMRVAKMNMAGETVVDLFAGIGYFTLPAAIHAKANRIFACEINPIAYHYLLENIRLNRAGNVVPLYGDNRDTAPIGSADRVFLGYVKTTHLFLPLAFRTLKKKGIIHYHEICSIDEFPHRPAKTLTDAAHEYGVQLEILRVGKVKSFGPSMIHAVIDAQVLK